MKKIFIFSLIVAFQQINAQPIRVIPKPAEVKLESGYIEINAKTGIYLQDESFSKEAAYLQKTLNDQFGLLLKIVKKIGNKNAIVLGKMEGKNPEQYYIKTDKDNINIHGVSNAGVFYGIQTIFQLFEKTGDGYRFPNLFIADVPRFVYRGMHLDVGRHFQPVSFIKTYLDYMATYKYNTFHWHLTEDQGWRIEIKKYPKLTSVGAWRNGTIVGRYPGTDNDNIRYGGFYTQEEVKEIVQYAADRNITVIPEIELPGHSSAAIAAYPELSCFPDEATVIPNQYIASASKNSKGKLVQETWGVFEDVFCPSDYTFKFLEDVMEEVLQLFPSKFIHIGGDECPKEAWKKSTFCQQLIKEKGLKNEHGLQSYFIGRIEKYLNSKGRNIIGWDEILEGGLAPNASVMSWRGEEGGIEAAKQHHTVIMTPGSHCYLDHSQSKNEDSITIGGFLPIEKVYDYEPIPKSLSAEEAKYVLGAQGNVWTEYMKYPSKIEYMIFPRMLALSEVLWSPKEGRSWSGFEPRLLAEMKKLKQRGINSSNALFDYKVSIEPTLKNEGVLLKVLPRNNSDTIKIVRDAQVMGSEELKQKGEMYKEPVWITKSETVKTFLVNNQEAPVFRKHSFQFSKATGKKIVLSKNASKSYPGNGGAFGLVNGIVSEKGIQSSEWLGFGEGQDAVFLLDLGAVKEISKIKIHTLDQQGSWIYLPEYLEIFASDDGVNFGYTAKGSGLEEDKMGMKYMYVNLAKIKARYLKILVKNYGLIPSGKPGASHRAWLFMDEVMVD